MTQVQYIGAKVGVPQLPPGHRAVPVRGLLGLGHRVGGERWVSEQSFPYLQLFPIADITA